MPTLTIEQTIMIQDPDHLCYTLRQRYANGEPLADADQETLGTVRQALALIDKLLTQRNVQICSPADAAATMILEMSALDQEETRVLLLSRKNHVMDYVTLYRGTADAGPTRLAEFFRPAITAGAVSILVIHNHPSGDPTPSPEDIHFTQCLHKAGELLDIEVVDHIIIAGGHFLSLKERGHFENMPHPATSRVDSMIYKRATQQLRLA